MFSPTIARELNARGHQVVAVAGDRELRAMTDGELFAWAASCGYTIATENVKDFRPLAASAEATGSPSPGLLFTSSRGFPRSRHNPGALIAALDAWMNLESHGAEEWLRRAPGKDERPDSSLGES